MTNMLRLRNRKSLRIGVGGLSWRKEAKSLYMSNNAQEQINLITNKSKIRYLDISNRDLAGQADLKEFTALTSLNSYNNKFENLDFLDSLPQKDQLKKLN